MTRRIGVVVNPERPDVGDRVVERLRELGCEVTATTPDTPDDLGAAIDEFVADGVDAIAPVGGDGTQRTAAARLVGTDVALAIVPGGTVNLLAQVIGVDDLDVAIEAAAGTTTRAIDVALVDDEPYLLNASTGWDAAVIEHVDDGAKRFGRVGYTLTGIREWVRSESARVRVALDGDTWYDDAAVTVLVMNVGQRASASLHLAPDAELDDGRLDVVVLRRHSFVALMKAAWSTLRGRDVVERDVVIGQAADIVVEWEHEVAVQRDGDERDRARRTTYTVDERPLTVMSPDAPAGART